jgi:hypothetical protein
VVESDADLHLVVYSEVLGTVSRLSFDPALRSFSFADEGLWRTGLDQLVVVRIGGEPWLLIYDRATGILDLKSPFDLTPENVVVK